MVPNLRKVLHLDFNIHACWEVEVGEGVDGFVGGIENVDEAFVGEDLVVVAGVLVSVGRGSDGNEFAVGREGDRADDLGAGGHGIFKNFGGGIVYNPVVIGFEFDSDSG